MTELGRYIAGYRANPVLFAREIIGVNPENYQSDIMMSVAKNRMTTVRSGHGVGKTSLMSWIILWFLTCFDFARVPCTAPTEHQLKDLLWAELAKWIYNSKALDSILGWTAEKVYMRGYAETWFAVARAAAKPDALQGFHAENLLFVIDEASGVRDELFQPIMGALTEDNARLLMGGNPTRNVGFFADSHKKRDGKYARFQVNGEDSKRVSRLMIQSIVDMFGIDSDPYRVRVKGEFPKAEADSFIPIDWIESAQERKFTEVVRHIRLGVDVARMGDDKSVVYAAFNRKYSRKVLEKSKNDIMELVGEVIQIVRLFNRQFPDIKIFVNVDCDGLGVGAYDRLKEQEGYGGLNYEAVECHFGGKGGKLKDGDPISFANQTGLMWGNIRQKAYEGSLILDKNDTLTTQLTDRKYKLNSDGQIVLERKEEMKRRGVSSPDEGDACALSLYEKHKPKARAGQIEFA